MSVTPHSFGRKALMSAIAVLSLTGIGGTSWALASGSTSESNTSAPEVAFTPSVKGTIPPATIAPATIKESTPVAAPTTVAAPGKAAPATATSRPSTLVAASEKGRLVVIDTKSGKTTKVLYTVSPGAKGWCSWLGDVQLSNDAQTVYFEESEELGNDNCRSVIKRISVDGGQPVVIAEGSGPRLSADGTKLAFTTPQEAEGEFGIVTLVKVLPLADIKPGVENSGRLVFEADCGCDTAELTWVNDNKSLLVTDVGCGCGGMSFGEIHKVNTETLTHSVLSANGGPAVLGNLSVLPSGDVMATEETLVGNEADPFMRDTRIVVMDSSLTKVKSVVAIGFRDRSYGATDGDATSKHLMYTSSGDLMVADNGGRAAKLATGIYSADW